MSISGDEKYVTVEGKLDGKTAKAIKIVTDLGGGWVPRSCCHFSTDKMVDDMAVGDDGSFQIMEWVAEKNGLA